MLRMAFTAVLGLLAAAIAQAHFPYIVADASGNSAKVVFSDDLKADANVNIEKIAGTKLTLRDSGGKETPLEWKKEDSSYVVNVPGSGTRMVYGITEYGVVQKGDAKPFKLVYFPKALLGEVSAREATIGEKQILEIVPSASFGKVKFQVLSAGKPKGDIEVSVLLPGGGKKTAKTDNDGFTPDYDEKGRYALNAKLFETKSGDFAGKKYEEIRNYSTLVYDFSK